MFNYRTKIQFKDDKGHETFKEKNSLAITLISMEKLITHNSDVYDYDLRRFVTRSSNVILKWSSDHDEKENGLVIITDSLGKKVVRLECTTYLVPCLVVHFPRYFLVKWKMKAYEIVQFCFNIFVANVHILTHILIALSLTEFQMELYYTFPKYLKTYLASESSSLFCLKIMISYSVTGSNAKTIAHNGEETTKQLILAKVRHVVQSKGLFKESSWAKVVESNPKIILRKIQVYEGTRSPSEHHYACIF